MCAGVVPSSSSGFEWVLNATSCAALSQLSDRLAQFRSVRFARDISANKYREVACVLCSRMGNESWDNA